MPNFGTIKMINMLENILKLVDEGFRVTFLPELFPEDKRYLKIELEKEKGRAQIRIDRAASNEEILFVLDRMKNKFKKIDTVAV